MPDPSRSTSEPNSGGPTSLVRVRVGELDTPQVRELRLVLKDLALRPRTQVVIDLNDLDDRHELTLLKLLNEAARYRRDEDSELVVVGPSARMAGYLRATNIRTATSTLVPQDSPCDLRLDFGSISHLVCVFRTPDGDPDSEFAGQPTEPLSVCAFGDICGARSIRPRPATNPSSLGENDSQSE